MSLQAAYNPHGAAVLDYHNGARDAVLICHQDGERDDVPAAFWFRDTFDPLEQLGLELCCGSVLDVGAGTGIHALELQRRGLDVVALDIAPECAVVMKERGVRQPVVGDLYEFNVGRFDTVICLCNGLDKVGILADLPRFLDRMQALLNPGGQLLADSFDLRIGATPATNDAMARKMVAGRYFGEIDLTFEYAGRRGAAFTVLHVDLQTLARFARAGGWSFEVMRQTGGHYLARLRPTA
jgi:2-polyprenyl-3-methyl-5-hydroxy-6-metoxy-1,4-benzoquinol methylase